jgi:UDP-N-acetylglucosamine kinase
MSTEEFTKTYQLIRRTVTKDKIPVENPVCITLGGQPGSGKSTLYGIAQQRYSNNVVELDCDAFRIYHPYYNEIKNIYGKNDVLKTNPFVFKTIDLLIDDLSNEKYHLIIESSLNSPNSALDNGRNLPPKGYKVELHIMATPKDISWQGTIDRYNYQLKHNGNTRAVSKEYHDLVIKNICNSLNTVKKSGLMSNIIIYNRKKQCLYNMNKHKNIDPCTLLYNIIHT